ncbi:MAG: hypothetical protein HC880_00775 [Bacteroidia bacterium]|nr:hypothetical protein [Bacteroidia bacterium]
MTDQVLEKPAVEHVTPPVTPVVEKPAVEEQEEPSLLGTEEETPKTDEKGEVPETYEFKVPEGMELDKVMSDRFTPVFKEIGLTQEQVQKLVDVYAPILKERAESANKDSAESYKEIVNGWKQETQDKLGAGAVKELAFAAKFINQMSDSPEEAKALRDFFNETGVGNYYLLNKLLIKAGKKISQDKVVDLNKQSQGSGDDLKVMYPTMHT